MNQFMKQDYMKTAEKKVSKKMVGAIIGGALFVTLAAMGVAAVLTGGIRLIGPENETIVLGEAYQEKGFEAAMLGMSLHDRVRVEGRVDTSKPGAYELRYRLEGMDWLGNARRTVEVQDIKIPELTLLGGTTIHTEINSGFQDPGYKAVDDYDGDLTSKVTVTGAVDTAVPGDYTLTYTVSDSSKNEARGTRTVTVLPPSPLTMGLAEFSMDAYYADVLLPETADAGEAYMQETVFIGDSITENGMVNGIYPRKCTWARHALDPSLALSTPVPIYGGGEDNKDIEMLLPQAAEKYEPKRVIINLGSNYAFKTSPETVASDYESFLKIFLEKSPNTKIIISSLYPVNRGYDDSEKTAYLINNEKINKINCALAELCRKNGYKFLNVAEALKDEEGHAKEGYLYEEDGMHPNSSTYAIIGQYIRSHAYPDA